MMQYERWIIIMCIVLVILLLLAAIGYWSGGWEYPAEVSRLSS